MQLSAEWVNERTLASCAFFLSLMKTWKHFGLHFEWGSFFHSVFILWCLHEIYGRYFFPIIVCSFVPFFPILFRRAHLSNFKTKHLKPSLSNDAIECLAFRCCFLFTDLLHFSVFFPVALSILWALFTFWYFSIKYIWIQWIGKHKKPIKRSIYYITYWCAQHRVLQQSPTT